MFRKLTFIFFLCVAVSPAAYANWVEDWFDTMNTTSPSSYQGQERGFATAGGFQARMRVKTDNLMTISPPRFNIGCGGIDIFMGGFSFLNADYMVDKFERIIRMAPALAFQVALNELSSTISEKVEGMEQIMNTLNALQLDECQAAKGIATFAIDAVKSGPEQAVNAVSTNIKSGINDFFNKAKKDAEEKPGKAVKDAIDSSSMPAALKAELKKSGSLLTNAGDKFGLTSDEINQLRALVGDVKVEVSDQLSYVYEPGCNEATFEALIEKKPFSKTLGGACTEASGNNIEQKVEALLSSIADKVGDTRATAPTAAEISFMTYSQIPVKHFLNIANKYGSAQVNTIKDSLRTPSAYGYAYGIFTNMLINLQDTLRDYQTWIKSGDPALTQSVELATKELLEMLEHKQREAYQAYSVKIGELNKVQTLVQNYAYNEKIIREILNQHGFYMPEKN